ncbi:adenine deaminase [Saccharomyces eubayanus]|uniref:adenine deaminase n=1 Tax=Saccharomyces eubayanus TaxID=1080349 RepID=UPI0006C004B1|nr:AAH1-like protein [Saccharomyces eubayanus]KOG97022.1 AAH1-like protein [Saccharomyces eubayanus]
MVSQEFLQELPKCEHHLHLEGTLEPDLLFVLAKRNNITLPDAFPKSIEELNVKYEKFRDLQDFLDYYYIGTNVLIKEQDFFDLAWAYFVKVHKQGLVHAEVFYDPQSHTSRDISIETVTKGFQRACDKAQAEFGITSKLIMCLLRHIEPEECLKTIEEATPFIKDGTISALGLDSAEAPFPPNLFVECYRKAASLNQDLRLTAHAGEEGSAQFVSDALDLLNVTRIDHGINSQHDDELLDRLARDQILLTVCPFSNVKLQVVKSVSELPLQKFLDKNVPFSLNSDDPAYFGGYILDNYIQVSKDFPHWDHETWGRIAKNAINGSWCDDKRKGDLLDKVDQVVTKYSN